MYLIYIVINDKQEISDRRCNAAYRLSFNLVFSFIWEIVDVLINKKKDFGCIIIISMVLVTSIANMLR